VPFIEEGEAKSKAMQIVAKSYLHNLRSEKIDTLIMGCTHYPIIRNVIKKEVDNNVKLIDPGVFVSREVADFLTENKMLNVQKKRGNKNFFVTDLTDRFTKVAEMFLGEKIKNRLKKVAV